MKPRGYTLITGGAGFIGSNLAHRLMEQNKPVLIFDSVARPGVEKNLRWLQEQHAALMEVQIAYIPTVTPSKKPCAMLLLSITLPRRLPLPRV